jgi:hypothetical protein
MHTHPSLTASFSYHLQVPNQHGTETIQLTQKQYEELKPRFESDPDQVVAELLGVKKHQYLSWLEDGFCVQCAGKTQKGKRCRRIAKDGHAVSVKEYVARQGHKCEVHEGQA